MSSLIITKELLDAVDACAETQNYFTANNLWNLSEEAVLTALQEANMEEPRQWWFKTKKTEKYVRATGKVFTMTHNYQVFNPLTGLHSQYASEAEAKEALARICEAIIDNYKPTVCQEITNENGDSAWTLIDLAATRKVTIE